MFDNCLTKGVEFPVVTHISMPDKKEIIISVRDFLRNYRKYATSKDTVIIQKNGKPLRVFVPYTDWEKEKNIKNQKMTIKEAIRGLTFVGADPDLSQNIDNILYGEEENNN